MEEGSRECIIAQKMIVERRSKLYPYEMDDDDIKSLMAQYLESVLNRFESFDTVSDIKDSLK